MKRILNKIAAVAGAVVIMGTFMVASPIQILCSETTATEVQTADYTTIFDPAYYMARYPYTAALYNYDITALYNHFLDYGISHGQEPSAEFNLQYYMSNYDDLYAAFGNNYALYYQNYIIGGKAEGRVANALIEGRTLLPLTAPSDDNYVLANSTNFISADYVPSVSSINNRVQLRSDVTTIVSTMMADAKAQGVNLYVVSGYRSYARQTVLFNNKTNYYLAKGYSRTDAESHAQTIVQRPGSSDHQTGLAMDITDASYTGLTESQENTAGYKWLYANCAKYGFILRYPKGKEDVTGITYEPWHFRYVGVEAATFIMNNNLTLEEYMAFINADVALG